MGIKIALDSLVNDAIRFCNDGFAGLLIIGGEESVVGLMEDRFKMKTEEKYPVVRRSVEAHTAAGGDRIFDGKIYYLVDLSLIEITNTPYQAA
jgi:hypothetical protein